jgi:hypothetical protein
MYSFVPCGMLAPMLYGELNPLQVPEWSTAAEIVGGEAVSSSTNPTVSPFAQPIQLLTLVLFWSTFAL